METIPKNTCTKVGFIQKPHGINGELIIRFQEQFYETLENTDMLYLEIEGLLVPFFFAGDGLRFRTGESALVKLNWIDHEEQVRELAGSSVYIKNEKMIASEASDIHSIKGFLLIDQHKTQIGTITEIHDYSGSILLGLTYLGKEILIPFNEDLIILLDAEKQILALDLPEGLLTLDEE